MSPTPRPTPPAEGDPREAAALATLLDLLASPESTAPVLAVLGRPGASSTATMLASLLGALGLTTGALLSPHLQDPRERIRVAGSPIEAEELTARSAELAPVLAEVETRHARALSVPASLAAVAAAHFADAPVDVVIVEVTAATRVLVERAGPSVLAVPLPVRPAAAAQAVDLLAAGTVAVCGSQATAATLAAPAGRQGGRVVTAAEPASRRLAVGGQQLDLVGTTAGVSDVYVPLHGAHQAAHAALALSALEAFLGFAGGLDPAFLREGFAATRLPGRLEVVRRQRGATVLLDLADDGATGGALAAALAEEFAVRNRVVVLGADPQTDVGPLLQALLPAAEHVILTPADPLRPVELTGAREAAQAAGVHAETAVDVAAALGLADGLVGEEDAVVVTGSAAAVGAARDALALPVT